MRMVFGLIAPLIVIAPSFALGLGDLSNQDAASGLKDALVQGSSAAVKHSIGEENGLLGNDKVMISMPCALMLSGAACGCPV